jgi:hypothetical protein
MWVTNATAAVLSIIRCDRRALSRTLMTV